MLTADLSELKVIEKRLSEITALYVEIMEAFDMEEKRKRGFKRDKGCFCNKRGKKLYIRSN